MVWFLLSLWAEQKVHSNRYVVHSNFRTMETQIALKWPLHSGLSPRNNCLPSSLTLKKKKNLELVMTWEFLPSYVLSNNSHFSWDLFILFILSSDFVHHPAFVLIFPQIPYSFSNKLVPPTWAHHGSSLILPLTWCSHMTIVSKVT